LSAGGRGGEKKGWGGEKERTKCLGPQKSRKKSVIVTTGGGKSDGGKEGQKSEGVRVSLLKTGGEKGKTGLDRKREGLKVKRGNE